MDFVNDELEFLNMSNECDNIDTSYSRFNENSNIQDNDIQDTEIECFEQSSISSQNKLIEEITKRNKKLENEKKKVEENLNNEIELRKKIMQELNGLQSKFKKFKHNMNIITKNKTSKIRTKYYTIKYIIHIKDQYEKELQKKLDDEEKKHMDILKIKRDLYEKEIIIEKNSYEKQLKRHKENYKKKFGKLLN
jgi:hypothetical protein